MAFFEFQNDNLSDEDCLQFFLIPIFFTEHQIIDLFSQTSIPNSNLHKIIIDGFMQKNKLDAEKFFTLYYENPCPFLTQLSFFAAEQMNKELNLGVNGVKFFRFHDYDKFHLFVPEKFYTSYTADSGICLDFSTLTKKDKYVEYGKPLKGAQDVQDFLDCDKLYLYEQKKSQQS